MVDHSTSDHIMTQSWIKSVSCDALKRDGRKVFRFEGRQIVLFDTRQGIYACNNRCPHEGYPLREGVLDEQCRLTCNWHNWKFDLQTGENQRDGDKLRVYPVEVRGDHIWIQVIDPPLAEQLEKTINDLNLAFSNHDYERLARELARLFQMGADPTVAITWAIEWSSERMEFGWTHAYAGAAEWLQLYDDHDGKREQQLICLLEAIGHMSEDTLREPRYPFVSGTLAWDEDAFVAAVEHEDETAALQRTRGALANAGAFAIMERGLARAALAHYHSFGHALIYIPRAAELIHRLGEGVAAPVLLSLVRSIVTGFREDLIPEFRYYGEALAGFGQGQIGRSPPLEAYVGLNPAKAMALTAEHGSAPPEELYRSLLAVNAQNMLTFDLTHLEDIDQPYGSDRGWLDFSHGLTFADAVYSLCKRYPELWPAGLLQMACFAGRNVGHADSAVALEDWVVSEPQTFFQESTGMLMDHGQSEYIVSVHLLKTVQAVKRLSALPQVGAAGQIALAALNRLLSAPVRRKMVRRTARQAMRFIRQDK